MTEHENNLLLTLLTKWQEEETDKALQMDTDVVLNCTHLILELQKKQTTE